jgi:hypothetical protein
MFKKIVLGLIVAAVSGGLIYGAINRTNLRGDSGSGAGAGQSNSGWGNRGSQEDEAGLSTELQNNNGLQKRNGTGNQGGNTRGGNQSPDYGTGLAQVDEVIEIEGIVSAVDSNMMLVLGMKDENVIIENRAWWYALEAGFNAAVNDEVRVRGFYDDGVYEAISLENLTQGTQVDLRDQTGRPLWAGGGR